jgi:hypothetical protein
VYTPGKVFKEVQQFGAPAFADITHASDPTVTIPQGKVVDVECVATGPIEAAPSAKGKWYRLAGEYAGRFAATNTFENGSTTGSLESQPAVDPLVPPCPPTSAGAPS